jgi:hypothetical protein
MVSFESLTQGVIVLAFYSMHDLLFMQLSHFSGLVRFLPSRLQLVYLLNRYWS